VYGKKWGTYSRVRSQFQSQFHHPVRAAPGHTYYHTIHHGVQGSFGDDDHDTTMRVDEERIYMVLGSGRIHGDEIQFLFPADSGDRH